jgi:glycosylphosphatidylinositol transamidase (GPIT) subunit GPI8
MLENQTFTTANDIYTHLHDMSDESEVGDAFDLTSASFIAVEDTKMLYDIARVRRKLIVDYYGTPMFASDDPFAVENDAYWQLLNSIYRTYFAFSGLSEESLAALGPDGRKMLQGYQGFSPYADPTTGFELSYQTKFGVMPTFAECKFYDALMLASFAACYVEHHEESSLNQAIVTITSTDNAPMGGSAWNVTPMQVYLSAMEGGQLYRFSGASGDISFDRDTYTAATTTTYVHWQIMDGEILHRSYFGSKGGARTTDASAAWLYLYNEKRASDDFMQQAGEGTDQHFAYPALTGQYAVLVQGSNGFDNYRHQADVLSIYQSLRRGGYPDDHIILILDKKMASDPRNPEPGVVRAAPDGPDLLGGTTTGSNILPAMVDYDSADLTASDVADILAGRQSDHLPVVVPQDEGNNVLFYWSGHGRSTSRGGANEFSWRETSSGKGFSAKLLKQTAQQMSFRKLLIAAEPCYGECVIRTVDGIPGVLAMSGANSQEQSWADCWSNDAKVWMCDRFSQNLVNFLSANPDTSFRDLFLYCAQHTLGSHARIVNAANFGNLYTTGPAEFIRYIGQ